MGIVNIMVNFSEYPYNLPKYKQLKQGEAGRTKGGWSEGEPPNREGLYQGLQKSNCVIYG